MPTALVPRVRHSTGDMQGAATVVKENVMASIARIDAESPSDFRCTLVELKRRSCRWPIGDPREDSFRFCGAHKASPKEAYCDYHSSVAYTKRPTR